MKLFKKFIVSLLVVIFVMSGVTPVFADSNARREYLINFAKGKSITEIDSTNSLTYDDLRLLGLFLSNYYIPWNTGVGVSTDEKEVKKQMSEALVDSCGFSAETVDVLVEAIFSMSVSTRKPLSVANGTTNGVLAESTSLVINKGSKSNINALKHNVSEDYPDATLYTFLGCMTGGFDKDRNVVDSVYADTDMDGDGSIFDDGDERFYLFWTDDNGVKHPVWEMDKASFKGNYGGKDISFTPCTASYLMMLDNGDYGNGNEGNALISVKQKTYEKMNDEQRSRVSIWDSQLYIDCFGNILCDVGTQLYVVVPACNNPYAWYSDSDGQSSAGKYVQLLNFFNIGEINAKNITCSDTDFTESTEGVYDCFDNGKGSFTYRFYSGSKSLYNLNYFRVTRGKSELDVDKINAIKVFFTDAEQYDLVTLLQNGKIGLPIDKEGLINQKLKVYFPNFMTYANSIKSSNKEHYSIINTDSDIIKGAFSDMVMIDTYETWKDSDEDPTSIPRTSIFHKGASPDKDGNYKFESIDTSISNMGYESLTTKDNTITKISGTEKKWTVSVFLSYYLAYANADSGSTGKVSYAFNKNGLPNADTKNVDFSSISVEASDDEMMQELKGLLYYIAHPIKGVSTVATWFKNKVGGILVSWHEDMVGKSSATSTTGTTRYLGFSGYVTLPELSDIPWTAWLLDNYTSLIIYVILFILVILVAYCIVGQMTFQRALIGIVLFTILAFFPPLAINASVGEINNVCDRIYGNKFTYWALVQHQQYISELNEKVVSETKSDYLKYIFNEKDKNVENNFASVKLKWMAPKKDNVQSNVQEELKNTSTNGNLTLMNNMIKNYMSGETFSDKANALYLYRDYADIYMYSSIAYRCSSNAISPINANSKDFIRDKSLREMTYASGTPMSKFTEKISDIDNETSLAHAQDAGFVVNTSSEISSQNKSFSFLLDSGVGTSLLEQNERIKEPEQTIYTADIESKAYGIPNESYNLTIANIQNNCTPDNKSLGTSSYNDQALLGYFYYGLYTESPFYFFTWNIYDQTSSPDYNCAVSQNSSGNLIDLYTGNNQSYFYNYSENAGNGYGEMRDFCNMRSLFYYVIPYLRNCNGVVLEWNRLNGLNTYEDVRLEYADDQETVLIPDFNSVDSKGDVPFINSSRSVNLSAWCIKDENGKCIQVNDEYIYKWWHNYNVERLFNVYTPWVDTLYDCDYAKPETIHILGDEYVVQDPLDPTSYYTTDEFGNITSGRPMIFSRSEMGYYGLTEADLTTVELKILYVQDEVYKNLLQLMDYYTFNDDVLITSAGMLTTFAFNNEFSQATPFGQSYRLYPLNYELKAFSYDAYLRLILAETTGESLLDTSNSTINDDGSGQKSFYQKIVEKSSITTGILFLILDLITVYAIPLLRFFFLIAIFIMSVAMILASAVDLDSNMVSTTCKSLVKPLLSFTVVSLGLAWIVSLFMSNGNTDVTGRATLAISLGDPSMVLLAMIIINSVALILYYNICKQSVKELINFLRALSVSISGALVGAFGGAALALVGGGKIVERDSKKLGDSVAAGTAKARGKMNTPHPKYTGNDSISNEVNGVGTDYRGGSGGIGYNYSGNPQSGGLATPQPISSGGADSDDKAAKKTAKYNKLSAEQADEIYGLDIAANRELARADVLSGGEYRARANEIQMTRNANQMLKEQRLEKIEQKKQLGERLTLSDRSYKMRMALSDNKLKNQQRKYTKQANKMARSNRKEIKKCNSRAELVFTTARVYQAKYSGEQLPDKVAISSQLASRKQEVARVQGRSYNAINTKKTVSRKNKSKAKNKRF